MSKRIRVREIAEIAGVSPSTVSRVATGKANVDPEIRARVLATAQSLGVRLGLHNAARILLFVLSNRDLIHPIHSRILGGANSYCQAADWELLSLSFSYRADLDWHGLQLPQILQRRDIVQGVILAGTNFPNLLVFLSQRNFPFAVFGNNVVGGWEPQKHDVVFADDIRGAHEATAFLLSLGHRNIWYVGDCTLPWMMRALEGYRRAMLEAGLEPRVQTLHSDEREVGYLGTKAILTRGEIPSAIFAGSDRTAEGVLRAVRDCRLRVPEDVSVVGLNDTEASLLHPPLTTVRSFPQEIGKHLAELVINRIADATADPQNIVIPTQLIKRESCLPTAARSATTETVGLPAAGLD